MPCLYATVRADLDESIFAMVKLVSLAGRCLVAIHSALPAHLLVLDVAVLATFMADAINPIRSKHEEQLL